MIKKVLFLFLAIAMPLSVIPCELPKDEVIKVGCSSACDIFYRLQISLTAWGMGYSTSIINLQEEVDLKKSMGQINGILLPGGADIDPKYYLSSVTTELQEYTKKNLDLVNFSDEGLKRDPHEYSIVKAYSEDDQYKNLPMLGICRGLQMMSVVQGIPLYLDIKTELGIENRNYRFDAIESSGDLNSIIQSLYSAESFSGFKLHHQGIRLPYYEEHKAKFPKTRVTAFSNDRKIAEAIEYTHRPALGIQYHPERSFSGTSAPVFKWFLTKACEHKISSLKGKI